MGLKLQDVPASAGLRWVKQGVAEYFRSPMSYTGLFVTFLLIYIAVLALSSLLAAAIPPFAYLGGLVLLMGVPLLTLAFQMGTESSLRGRVLSAAIYLAPWRQKEPDRRRALLVLLLTYALLTIALFELTSLIDGGAFDALMAAASQGGATEEELARLGAAPGAMAGFVWRAAFTVLLSIPFWHAPALVFWGGQGPAQAMFSSALAVWRARGAFTLFALGWLGAMLAAGTLAGIVMGVLGVQLAGLVIMPIALILSAAFYVSLFFGFRDSFGEPE
jgi:hypothetical protein